MATINDIGIPGVGSGILQPKLKNRWRVTFANLGGGGDSQPLSMQAISVTRPQLTFEEVPLHRYNSIAYVAGKHSWSPLSIVAQDDVTGSAAKVIQQQVSKQQQLIGAGAQWLAVAGEGSLYKFVTILEMMDGNDQPIERWTVEGCWFKETNWDTVDYSSNDPVTVTLSIRYDHARQDINGYSRGPGNALGGAGP
jgi:hypothetical protein